MIPTFVPFISRALRRFRLEATIREAAVESWQIEPLVETRCSPAIYDQSELGKITGVPDHTTLEYQMQRLTRTKAVYAPRYAHRLRNVVMVQGHLFKWNTVIPLSDARLPSVSAAVRPEIESAVLVSTEHGNRFFGHWLCDDVPLTIFGQKFGRCVGHVGKDNSLSEHQKAYSDIFELNVDLAENAFFRQLIVFDWSDQSPYQYERYNEMRRLLGAGRPDKENCGVMILRGSSGQRRILDNEMEVAELATRLGFAIVDPMKSTVDDILRACWNAKIVLGTEGSHLAHGFLPLHPSGTMLLLQPPFKFDQFWKDRTDCLGLRYACLIGDQTSNQGFGVNLAGVAKMLDVIQSTLR